LIAAIRQQLLQLRSRHRVIYGIPVMITNNRAHATTAQLFTAVERSLSLIAKHRPRALWRMQKDVSLIWIDRFAVCRAIYYPATRTIRMDSSFVATFPVTAIASSLVHEATHARIRSVVHNWPRNNASAKEERICRLEELRFGRALPGGGDVVERAAASIRQPPAGIAPAVDWRHANARAARIRLRETRLPLWLKETIAQARGIGTLRQQD
jgi:hypothetical protein